MIHTAKLKEKRILKAHCIILFFTLVSATYAQTPQPGISVSFPLEGYFRAGAYMPVRVTCAADVASQQLTLDAQGAMPTQVDVTGSSEVIIPFLTVQEALSELRLKSDGRSQSIAVPLHALAEDERLVGFAGADADALKAVFGSSRIVGVPLDLAKPLSGPMSAWESLDGVVLDASAAVRVTESQLAELLACGIAVGIRSATKPAGAWPWEQVGEYWLLNVEGIGPRHAFNPGAYSPTAAMTRGWPDTLRHGVLLSAIVLVLLTIGTTLWQSKYSAGLVVLLAASAVATSTYWRTHQALNVDVGGTIVVQDPAFTQIDYWRYRAAVRPSQQTLAWDGVTWPQLGYHQQLHDTRLNLVCDASGTPQRFEFELEPQKSLAFLTRKVQAEKAIVIGQPARTSPLQPLVDELYPARGYGIAIQQQEEGNGWPMILMHAQASDRIRDKP